MVSPQPFAVETRATGGRIIRLAGELDLATAPQVVDVVSGQIRQGSPSEIIVHLAAVTFCDCSGLRALGNARKLAAAAGIPFGFADPPQHIRRLVRLTGCDLLDLIGDRSAA